MNEKTTIQEIIAQKESEWVDEKLKEIEHLRTEINNIMKNEDKEKAKQIAEESQYLSDFPHDYHSVEYGAMKMAEWKDSKIRDILMAYTLWLDKRGFFAEDLQCDFEHQIETFLEMSNIKIKKENKIMEENNKLFVDKLFVDFDKVSDYIKENLCKYLYCVDGQAGFPTAQFIEDMKKQICEDRKRELIETYADAVLGEGNYDPELLLAMMDTRSKMMHNNH